MNDLMKDLGSIREQAEPTAQPGKLSPARSDAGNLRNFKRMGDAKLYALWEQMQVHQDDTEAYAAVEAEVEERDL